MVGMISFQATLPNPPSTPPASSQTHHSAEFRNLPQQPVLIKRVQGFASDYIDGALVYLLVQSRHQQIERFSNSLLGKDAKVTVSFRQNPLYFPENESFSLWPYDRRQEAVFSNNQHAPPKKTHFAPLRTRSKTQETASSPQHTRVFTHAHAHSHGIYRVADHSFMLKLLYGSLMLISWPKNHE